MDTGYTWIDGKHIYKKTVDFGALPDSTEKWVNHGISNLGFVIHTEAYAYNPTGKVFNFVPVVSTSSAFASLVIFENTININALTNRSNYTQCYITLYYTKTS